VLPRWRGIVTRQGEGKKPIDQEEGGTQYPVIVQKVEKKREAKGGGVSQGRNSQKEGY